MSNIADGIDIVLKDWATEKQARYIDFINEHKNVTHAANFFGVARSTIQKSIESLKVKAAGGVTLGVIRGISSFKASIAANMASCALLSSSVDLTH